MSPVSIVRLALAVCVIAAVAGCARPKPAPPPQAPVSTAPPANPVQLERAVIATVADVVAQLKRSGGVFDRLRPGAPVQGIIVDRFVDSVTGQATKSTRALDTLALNTLKIQHPELDAVAVSSANVAAGRVLLAGAIGLEPEPQGSTRRWRVHISATDVATRIVAATSSAWIEDKDLDTTPTAANAEAPVYLRDRALDAQIETARVKPGTTAAPAYLENLPRSVVTAEAEDLYEQKRYDEALAKFLSAASMRNEPSPRVHSGGYLTNMKLNRPSDAEREFGKLVEIGLESGSFAARFLFRVNSTEFVPDPTRRAEYAIWMRQISRTVAASRACATLVGHASRTGAEAYNDRLSLQRAEEVRRHLVRLEGTLSSRTTAEGKGFRENLVGSGTDDERDQLDRRVEIRSRSC